MTDSSPYYQLMRNEVAQLLPKQYSRVLEIGCGEGAFREHLKPDCEYWGVEPSSAAAAIAARKMNRVLTGTFQEVAHQLPEKYFDLVICNDVIEHMADHDEFLQAIKKNLQAKSCLVGSIPNVRFIRNLLAFVIRRDWEYKKSGILDRTHLRFFTEKSLRRTLMENGYAIEEFRGINPIKGIVNRWLCSLAVLLLGRDVRFLQFGMRIRPAGR